ncbi:MAG TPA: hypothetical protein VKE94_16320, partial [Gemmataceae bacterium]|nr:hypothetical protein [Gemmataceae bacterium]
MSSTPDEKPLPESSEFQSLASRLRAMEHALQGSAENMEDEVMPHWDAVPIAEAAPQESMPPPEAPAEELAPLAERETPPPIPELPAPLAEAPVETPPATPRHCPICNAVRLADRVYCDDCGFMFPPDAPDGAPASPGAPGGTMRAKTRYEFGAPYAERLGVTRHKGVDQGTDGNASQPVVVIRRLAVPEAEPVLAAEVVPDPVETEADEEIVPGFDETLPTSLPVT